MGKKVLKQSVIDSVIYDWELGLYKNFNKLSKAHGIAFNTASKIIKDSGAEFNSRSCEVDEYVEASVEFIKSPTDENKARLQESEDKFQITNLFSLDEIKNSSSGLIKDTVIDEMKLQLIQSNVVLVNALANNNIRNNNKTLVSSSKEDGISLTKVPLDSGDLKNYSDIFDKSLLSLGLAPRHAPKNDVNVLTQINSDGEVESTRKGVSDFYSDNLLVANG